MADLGSSKPVLIVGAAPPGLTAALELSNHEAPALVLGADNLAGRLARTVNHKGYLFEGGDKL